MSRIVDELHEPPGRQLIRQPLHSLAAGRPHLSDLRHGKRTNERQAAHESERTATPARYETCSLTKGPQPKEELECSPIFCSGGELKLAARPDRLKSDFLGVPR